MELLLLLYWMILSNKRGRESTEIDRLQVWKAQLKSQEERPHNELLYSSQFGTGAIRSFSVYKFFCVNILLWLVKPYKVIFGQKRSLPPNLFQLHEQSLTNSTKQNNKRQSKLFIDKG